MVFPAEWVLPDEIKKRFGETSPGKQRAMYADGHLLLVLHKAPKAGQDDRKSVFFWRKPSGEWFSSTGQQGIQALQGHVKMYIREEDRIDLLYERAKTAEDYFAVLAELSPLEHAAKNMHNTLQSARESVPDDRAIIDLRDWASNVERNLSLLYTDAKNALDFDIARRAEEQSELGRKALKTSHRLNILAAIFFPLTAITSLFGMSLPHGMEHVGVWLFWIIFVAGLGLGAFMYHWVSADGSSSKT